MMGSGLILSLRETKFRTSHVELTSRAMSNLLEIYKNHGKLGYLENSFLIHGKIILVF